MRLVLTLLFVWGALVSAWARGPAPSPTPKGPDRHILKRPDGTLYNEWNPNKGTPPAHPVGVVKPKPRKTASKPAGSSGKVKTFRRVEMPDGSVEIRNN